MSSEFYDNYIQEIYKHIYIYRVSIKYFPDYKHFFFNNPTFAASVYLDILEVYFAPQTWIIFQQDGAPPHWGSQVRSVFGCKISKQVDWERRSYTMATTIAGYHPPPP
jgi:hypothetical protein